MISRLSLLFAAPMALAALTIGCGDASSATPSTAAPSASSPAETASPTASGPAPLSWPADKKTGDANVDALLDAVRAGDAARLQALMTLVDVPCANEGRYDGPNALPSCGQSPLGTPVATFPISTGCEGGGSWQPGTYPPVESVLTRKPALYAVYRQPGVTAAPPARLPSGATVVVLRNTVLADGGLAIEMEGARVVRFTFPCGPFPYALLTGVAKNTFIVPPPGGVASLTPTPTPVPRLTGNATTDRFIRLAVDGDYRALAAAFDFFPEPCETNPQGVGSTPRCPAGVPDGGTVQGARLTACERAYVPTTAALEALLRTYFVFPHQLYAVFRSDGSLYANFVPTGETAIVISDPKAESARVIYLAGSKITGMRLGCGESPVAVTKDVVASAFVIAPR